MTSPDPTAPRAPAPPPAHPIAAVTHPDPYPYYAELVARRPLYRDDALGLWVASSAEAVMAVLTSDRCRVRPPAEPVPAALAGSAAGEVFGRLVRMSDGAAHQGLKPAVSVSLQRVDPGRVAELAADCAARLAGEVVPRADPGRLADYAFRLPAHVIAGLLGIPRERWPETATWVGDFVRCLAPASGPEDLERGAVAASRLRELVRSTLAARPTGAGLLATLHGAVGTSGDADAVVANGIGFLSQAYEATAGLIGNTLLALGAHPEAREQAAADPAGLPSIVREVLRHDPPIQNTRRFVAASGPVAGQPMQAGDAVLVVLAAANRDPAANPHPDRFDPSRRDRRTFTFGGGTHACPGEVLATAVAAAGVRELVRSGVDPARLGAVVAYRPSVNARIPLFGALR